MSKILIDTESKSVAFLDAGGGATVVAKDATATIKADGTVTAGNNPATGQPITVVPGYVSEWATLLTGLQSVGAGKANPTQTDGGAPGRTVKARPGDDLPIPGPKEIINVELEHPVGVGVYGWKVPAGVSGKGWIKGRSASGDTLAVRYALNIGATPPQNLGPTVGSMELPINFDGDEKDGMSNTGPGFNGKLTLDNVAGTPIVLQLTRA